MQTPRSKVWTVPLCRVNYINFQTVEVERIHADEENLLDTVERGSQEAIVSCLSLQWVNDLPGMPSKCYIKTFSTNTPRRNDTDQGGLATRRPLPRCNVWRRYSF